MEVDNTKELSIIIVNYKTPQLTRRCIESVCATTKCNYEIIVVDNASHDESRQYITSNFPKVVWIQNDSNEGFGRANNIGVSIARGEYILLLNSDMVVMDNTIDYCLEQVKQNECIAAYTCKLANVDGTLQKNISTDVVELKRNLNNNIVYVKLFGEIPVKNSFPRAIMGAYMMMKKSVFNEFCGFDPDFFMYFEEIDLCRRILMNGKYYFDYTNNVYAIHKHEGSSTGKLWNRRQRLASEALMVYKMYGISGYALYHLLQFNNVFMNLGISVFKKKYLATSVLAFKAYTKNIWQYIIIPWRYSRNIGNGKKMLKIQ